jgi:hypothetical protein
MIHAMVMVKKDDIGKIVESIPMGWTYEGQFRGEYKSGSWLKTNTDISISNKDDSNYTIKIESDFLPSLEVTQTKEQIIDLMQGLKILYFGYCDTGVLLYSCWTWNIYQDI